MNNVKNKIAQYGLLALTLIATVQVGRMIIEALPDNKNHFIYYNIVSLSFIGLLWWLYFGLFVRKHSSVASPQKKLLN